MDFFTPLFQGRHDSNGNDTGESFQQDGKNLEKYLSNVGKLSNNEQEMLQKPIEEEEIEELLM